MKALITGASSGIGKEMAKILANSYDELVLVGRNKERLDSLANELEKKCKIDIEVIDLCDKEKCQQLYLKYQQIDLLINNAGFGDYGEFIHTSLEKELDMIYTNVIAVHILTKLYLKDMKKHNHGHILNVASIAGFMPGPFMATYYATKGYVVRLSEAIREELRREHSQVKISILCPGPVATNFETTANVHFSFRGMDCHKVAEYALKHLHKFYIVPGLGVKISRIFMQILPGTLSSRIIYHVQSARKKID